MTLPERIEDNDRKQWHADKFSLESRREFAEAVYHGDIETALRVWFRAATCSEVDAYLPPTRPVECTVVCEADLDDDQRAVVSVSVGDETADVTVDDEQTRELGGFEDGEYATSAVVERVVVVDPDTLETTEYAVDDYSLTVDDESVAVDTESTALGSVADSVSVTVGSITVGDKL